MCAAKWGHYRDGTRDLSRDEERSPRGWLGRRDSNGGETIPDRAWHHDPPTADEDERQAA